MKIYKADGTLREDNEEVLDRLDKIESHTRDTKQILAVTYVVEQKQRLQQLSEQ